MPASPGPSGAGYDVTHRAFLQAFLARQVMTFAQAQPVLAAILTAKDSQRPTQPGDITPEDFEEYVHQINTAISPFDLEIRSTKHQSSEDEIFALINTTSDALTQMSTIHTADEIAFVRRVLDAMFETYNTPEQEIMAITAMQAIRLHKPTQEESRRDSRVAGGPAPAAALTQGQAESMMESMVSEGWFELSHKGYYSLSPRALMELREWLVDTYNESPVEDEDQGEDEDEATVMIKTCAACKDIITVGQRCARLECLGRLHTHCAGRMFRAQGGQQACPICKSPWTNPLPVGEKAARAQRPSQANGASQRRRSGHRGNVDEDDED